ncbi:phospholipid carrier-dependent glycosyltransferase [Isoptericola sp. NPDC019482]|uniref:dolichyl-phosphate-mannose--protein mannosyltransferase n=1 Tax=Isoptericola sp. NPDC019482 TaxID=3154688 RepID=UPI0034983791
MTAPDADATLTGDPAPAGTPPGQARHRAGDASTGSSTGASTDGGEGSPPPFPGTPAPSPTPSDGDGRTTQARLLDRLLGARRMRLDLRRRDRFWGWFGTIVVTLLAAATRLWQLGQPHTLVFDETYYVKDAFTLGRLGFEAQWPDEPNPAFEAGDVLTYLDKAAYVVHPPIGKWMIWLGMEAGGGATSSFAWRLSSAVIGILAVLLLVRIARRLFASSTMGIVAGLLLAVDGEAIVHSRTALLDQFLMFWVLVAFGCLVMDREQARRRLAGRVSEILDAGGTVARYGPRLGFRWWRLAAGVSLGLACGTKWSGLWFVAVFGILTVLWDLAARRAAGVGRWWEDSLVVDAVPAFLTIVPTAFVVYVASWWSWFVNQGAYLRQWAAEHPGEGVTWLPEPLRSLLHYHQQMWDFHTGLASEHPYASNPLGWIVQWRPTSFFWEKESPGQGTCPSDAAEACARAVTSLGNPLLWLLGAIAIVVTIWLGVRLRDWRALAVLSGTVAGWLPWLPFAAPFTLLPWFHERTIFTFYSIVFTPFVVLTLVYPMMVALERTEGRRRERALAVAVIVAVLAVILVVSAIFYPLWTGMQVPYSYWQNVMRLESWI